MTHQEKCRRQQARFAAQHSASPDRPFELRVRNAETDLMGPYGTGCFFATQYEAQRFGTNQGFKCFAVVEAA